MNPKITTAQDVILARYDTIYYYVYCEAIRSELGRDFLVDLHKHIMRTPNDTFL